MGFWAGRKAGGHGSLGKVFVSSWRTYRPACAVLAETEDPSAGLSGPPLRGAERMRIVANGVWLTRLETRTEESSACASLGVANPRAELT